MKKDDYQHHISQQFNAELETLRTHLMEMGGLVEKQLADAIVSLVDSDSGVAAEVLRMEPKINALEVTIDEECQRILAKRQPAASDLRLIIAVTKCTSDLERIGDESAKIAKMAINLAEEGASPKGYVEVRHIGSLVRAMVHDTLDAFARFDAEKGIAVARKDKEVDVEYKSAMRALVTFMMEDPRSISRILSVMWSLRALERIGDHARNVSEQVIYLVKGKDVRHRPLDEIEEHVVKPGSGGLTR
ncbi:MAG: phosphate signaling complex protein PhoU [Pseudomonadota bacterium]